MRRSRKSEVRIRSQNSKCTASFRSDLRPPTSDVKLLALRGFTLIELLIVIGIIGIIVATSIPAYLKYAEQTRLKAATREVIGLLSLARQSAMSSRQPKTVVFDEETSELRLEEPSAIGQMKGVKLPKNVSVHLDRARAADEAPNSMVFQPSGTLSGRSATLSLTSHGRTQVVTVSGITGGITLSSSVAGKDGN